MQLDNECAFHKPQQKCDFIEKYQVLFSVLVRNGCTKVVGMCVLLNERGMIHVLHILKLITYSSIL